MWRPRFVQTFSDKIPDFFQTFFFLNAKFKPTFVLKHLPQFKNVCLVTADQCMDAYTSLISTPNINVCLTLFCLSSCKNLTSANLSCRPFRFIFLKVMIPHLFQAQISLSFTSLPGKRLLKVQLPTLFKSLHEPL